MLDSCKMVEKQSEEFHIFLWYFFPTLKQNFIAYHSSKVSSHPDCLFEIYQLWQSGFSKVYSDCCGSCSFEAEIVKIGQSSHNMYSNNIMNFQESTIILNACTKKVWKPIEGTMYVRGAWSNCPRLREGSKQWSDGLVEERINKNNLFNTLLVYCLIGNISHLELGIKLSFHLSLFHFLWLVSKSTICLQLDLQNHTYANLVVYIPQSYVSFFFFSVHAI